MIWGIFSRRTPPKPSEDGPSIAPSDMVARLQGVIERCGKVKEVLGTSNDGDAPCGVREAKCMKAIIGEIEYLALVLARHLETGER